MKHATQKHDSSIDAFWNNYENALVSTATSKYYWEFEKKPTNKQKMNSFDLWLYLFKLCFSIKFINAIANFTKREMLVSSCDILLYRKKSKNLMFNFV